MKCITNLVVSFLFFPLLCLTGFAQVALDKSAALTVVSYDNLMENQRELAIKIQADQSTPIVVIVDAWLNLRSGNEEELQKSFYPVAHVSGTHDELLAMNLKEALFPASYGYVAKMTNPISLLVGTTYTIDGTKIYQSNDGDQISQIRKMIEKLIEHLRKFLKRPPGFITMPNVRYNDNPKGEW